MVKKSKKTIVKKQKNGDTVIIKKNSEVGYKKPPKHTQFKKGIQNNKGITISPEKRALKELTINSLAEAIKKTMTCTEEEITALLNDPTTTVGHKVILRAALDAAHHGEYSKFDHILERAIGKVSTKVDITTGGRSLNEKLDDKEKVKQALKQVEEEI